jgi:DNA-binding CsgD family transcriptional regulator
MMIDKTVEPGHTPHMIVFINGPEKRYDIDIRLLMSLYGLTRAEAMLAKYLAEGANLDQAAGDLGIARNTARAQLRSIFAKTGVSQQSMLVSLILKSLVTFS